MASNQEKTDQFDEFQSRIIPFRIYERFLNNQSEGEKFAMKLPNNEIRAKRIFGISKKFDFPVLESVYLWLHNCACDDPLRKINTTLMECGKRQISSEEIRSVYFTHVAGGAQDPFEDESKRKYAYEKIVSSVTIEAKLVAHFLLSFQDAFEIYEDCVTTGKKPIAEILTSWTRKTSREKCTWKYLSSILRFVGLEKLTKDINEEFGIKEETKNRITADPVFIKTVVRVKPQVLTYTAHQNHYRLLTKHTAAQPHHVEVITSGHLDPTVIPFQHYIERCAQFLSEFFQVRNRRIENNIRFPPEYMCNDKAAELATKFEGDHTVVITHYDVIEQLKLLDVDLKHVSDLLDVDLDQIGNCNNRFLVCNLEQRCIINVRYSEARNELEALEDLKCGDEDVRLLLFTFGQQVIDTNSSILNVVAAPNMECECKNELIFTKSMLESNVLRENIKRLNIECNKLQTDSCEEEGDWFEAIFIFVSLILGFLATRSIKNSLLFETTAGKLQSIWLRVDQVKAIFHERFWKIICGGYGSGKSIIAKYLIHHLVKFAQSPTDIYYILYDNNSLFLKNMQDFCAWVKADSPNSKANLICANTQKLSDSLRGYFHVVCINEPLEFTLANILKVLIMKYQEKTGTSFHLIVEEVDTETLDERQSKALREIFDEGKSELSSSHILFVTRSMEKQRWFLSQQKRLPYKTYQCYHSCGMHIVQLTKCMRTPKKVFKIIQAASNIVVEPNVIPLPEAKLESSTPDRQSSNRSRSEQMLLSGGKNIDRGSKPYASQKQKLYHSVNLLECPTIVDPNDFEKNGDEYRRKYRGSKTRIETTYVYNRCQDVGHDIEGSQPTMIFLNYNNEDNEKLISKRNVGKLAIALEKECFHASNDILVERTVVICNNNEECMLFQNAMSVLNIPFIVAFNADDAQRDLKGRALITNHDGARGIEYDQVILVCKPNETYKRQYLVESMSRCTDHLVLMIPYSFLERPTVNNLPQNENEVCCCASLFSSPADRIEFGLMENSSRSLKTGTVRDMILELKKRSSLIEILSYTTEPLHQVDQFLVKKTSNDMVVWVINSLCTKCDKYVSGELLTPVIDEAPSSSNVTFDRPSKITGLHLRVLAKDGNQDLVQLVWNKVSVRYLIESLENPHDLNSEWEEVCTGWNTNFQEVRLESGKTYVFRIFALSALGNLRSEPSETSYPTRLAASPEYKSFEESNERIKKINEVILKLQTQLSDVIIRSDDELRDGKLRTDLNIKYLETARKQIKDFPETTQKLLDNIDERLKVWEDFKVKVEAAERGFEYYN